MTCMLPVMVYELVPWWHSTFSSGRPLLESIGIVLLGGGVAFWLVVAEVKLVAITSTLTLGVFGQLKEMVQASVVRKPLSNRCQIVETR
jgi:hypothetical protein